MKGSSSESGRDNELCLRMARLSLQKQSTNGRASRLHVPKIPQFARLAKGNIRTAVAGGTVVLDEIVQSPMPIPINYPSASDYLKDMQAHTQQEFEASVRNGRSEAARQSSSGWLRLNCVPRDRQNGVTRYSYFVDGCRRYAEAVGDNNKKSESSNNPTRIRMGESLSLLNELQNKDTKAGSSAKRTDKHVVSIHQAGKGGGAHNFEEKPWSLHAVQLEGQNKVFLVTGCKVSPDDSETARLFFAEVEGGRGGGFPRPNAGSASVRIRSLGYVGSFMRQYGAAADLIRGRRASSLLPIVAAPRTEGQHEGGTFTEIDRGSSIDTFTAVPINKTQDDAVTKLGGGLDIIVGPPGTGKSTMIWHIINSRVDSKSRVLVSSVRNQAINAVTLKVAPFGILVFGNKDRLGEDAKNFTIYGRLSNDPELMRWDRIVLDWDRVHKRAIKIAWENSKFNTFPGVERLRQLQNGVDIRHAENTTTASHPKAVDNMGRRCAAAGRWIVSLRHVFHQNFITRLNRGGKKRRRFLRQNNALEKWVGVLTVGLERAKFLRQKLEKLTTDRIYLETRVFLCTIDSIARMCRERSEGIDSADAPERTKSALMSIDTAIIDEAACVLETAVPVVLALGVRNITLIGDQHQLQPFSYIQDGKTRTPLASNHSRSLMERALDAGVSHHFLDIQYRMHPTICSVVSAEFYGNRLLTAPETQSARRSSHPVKWVSVAGREMQHNNQGYSNRREVRAVVKQALGAIRRHGVHADVCVITFYNMQKHELEHAFKRNNNLRLVRLLSVDACQGSDADVIIISTVRSSRIGCKLSGFMLNRRRINVALSRAREECIIVGDNKTLRNSGGATWRSVVDHYSSS